MDSDDRQIGRILGRREALALLGGVSVGAAGLAARGRMPFGLLAPGAAGAAVAPLSSALAQTALCVVRPELTEGPYFVADQLNRSDIRSEPSDGSVKEGTPLTVTFNVMQVGSGGGCNALSGAQVDLWHCDALGTYSGVSDPSFPGGGTIGLQFLRGYQLTDASGAARFSSIFPGWYSGRAVHIHFKIRTTDPSGGAYEFTSQFFFDDAFVDQVHALAPYNSKGSRDTRNDVDMIFNSGGDQLLLTATSTGSGYAAALPIALDLSDASIGASDVAGAMGGRGEPPAGGPPPGAPGFGGPPPGVAGTQAPGLVQSPPVQLPR
jgi:protocatechuate 3,4-dioxygenase beta subunit